MTKKCLVYFVLLPYLFFGQKNLKFLWPIDSPRVITGNYGELRPNHFHAGLDFSTGGQINKEVYAAEQGYVSRIKVSSGGYGKCVYITHPNGKVTVYAHLNSFSLKIGEIVKKQQYGTSSYEVEVLPKPGLVTVKKNEIIGLSGNTGGSTGPHLHFEIRDEKSEVPLNPLRTLQIADHTLPVLQQIAFFDLTDTCAPKFFTSFKVRQNATDSLSPERDTIFLDQSQFGLAYSGFDQYLPNGNPNNIYSAKLFLDGKLIYSHALDGIDFAESRFVNEFSATIGKIKWQKCFMPTLYPTGIYGPSVNKGRLILNDSSVHKIKLLVADESGNTNRLVFWVRAMKISSYAGSSIKSDVFVNCSEDLVINRNNMQIYIPANTLYYSTPIIFENTIETTGKLIVLPSEANLRASCVIGFKIPGKFLPKKTKLVLRNGNSTMTPINANDSVYYFIKNFGWFQLEVDTAGPRIKTLLTHRKIKKLKNFNSFSFVITDKLSGVSKYNVYVNNKWVLAEYDAKYDLLTYYFDEETPAGPLNFRVEVEDKVGNRSKFEMKLKH